MYRPGTRARAWVPLELLYTPAKNNFTQRYWYETDAHGSVVALTGAAGNVVDSYAYDAWGRPTASSELVPQPLWYRGYVYDRELKAPGEGAGWYWLSVRSYDPTIGRFIQPDPSEQEGTRSYVYAGDDPLDASDPSGLAGVCIGPLTIGDCSTNPDPGQVAGGVSLLVGAAAITAAAVVGDAFFPPSAAGNPTEGVAAAGMFAAGLTLVRTGLAVSRVARLGLAVSGASVGLGGARVLMSSSGGGGGSGADLHQPSGGAAADQSATGTDRLFPETPEEMDQTMGFEGTRIPDQPFTPGRDRVIWDVGRVRIRAEQHPYDLNPDEPLAPRHHAWHYHVEVRPNLTTGWSNPAVSHLQPPDYVPGEGTGFLPGEELPGA